MAANFAFTNRTFAYFEGARKHSRDREWFEANRDLYTEHVELPLTHLVTQLRERLSPMLPGIAFSPRKIAKPLLRQSGDADVPLLRANATAFFSEAATSMFEMNPGIYLSIGAEPEDNVIGCGIYMPSGRQWKELRSRLSSDAEVLRKILNESAMQAHWQGLTGERYKRFPKGFDEHAAAAEYMWHKQFFLGRQRSRTEMKAPAFLPQTVEAFAAAVPFLTWVRDAVGVYKKPKQSADQGE